MIKIIGIISILYLIMQEIFFIKLYIQDIKSKKNEITINVDAILIILTAMSIIYMITTMTGV